MAEPIRVGIGIIGRSGYYLIRQRPPTLGSPMPGLWEFPGGKCEPGEPPEQAARRECEEEVGAPIVVKGERRVTLHRYPHGLVELHYYDCELADPHAEPAEGTGFRWVAAGELPGMDFPEANAPLLDELAAETSYGTRGRRGASAY